MTSPGCQDDASNAGADPYLTSLGLGQVGGNGEPRVEGGALVLEL